MSGKMKILVTGSSGFIGHHLVRYLVAKGYHAMTLDIQMPPDPEVDGWPSYSFPIAVLPEMVERLEREQFDCVVHLAAQTSVNNSVANPGYDATHNILGTISVLEFCSALEIPLVYAASGGTCFGYDGDEGVLRRVPIVTNASPYALSKQVGEAYCELYHRLRGLQYISLRLANVYGLGGKGVISKWLKAIMHKEPIVINGEGKQRRDFIYVSDVVRAFEVAIRTLITIPDGLQCNEIGHVGCCETHSMVNVLSIMASVTEEEILNRVIYKDLPPGEVMNATMMPTRWLENEGWAPMVDLESGIKRLWELVDAEEKEKEERAN